MKKTWQFVFTIVLIFVVANFTACSKEDTTPTITVSNATEFLNSIQNNSNIVIDSNTLDFTNVGYINNPNISQSAYGTGYVIRGIENLNISASTTIVVDGIQHDVITLENCNNVRISGLKFKANDYDSLGWLECLIINQSNDIVINACDFDNVLFAVDATESSLKLEKNTFSKMHGPSIYAVKSTIDVHESSILENEKCVSAISTKGSIVNFEKCKLSGIHAEQIVLDSPENWLTNDIYEKSEVVFLNCKFTDNAIGAVAAKETKESDKYIYENDNIKFQNCAFENNIYCYGTLTSNSFVGCSFLNNEIGIRVPNFVNSGSESAISDLNASGIPYTVTYTFDDCDDLNNGKVISQSIDGVVRKNESIALTIATPAVTINKIYFEINFLDGVEISMNHTNNSEKQIAYMFFTIELYDRMGYPAYCSIRNTYQARLKVTGPIEAKSTDSTYWDPIIYNSTVGAIKPTAIEIVFTDGTKQTVTNSLEIYWQFKGYYGGPLHD